MSLSTVTPDSIAPSVPDSDTNTDPPHSQTARAHSSSLLERVSDALTNFNARPAPRHGAMVIDMRIVCVHSTVMDAVCPIAMVVNSKEMRGIVGVRTSAVRACSNFARFYISRLSVG